MYCCMNILHNIPLAFDYNNTIYGVNSSFYILYTYILYIYILKVES